MGLTDLLQMADSKLYQKDRHFCQTFKPDLQSYAVELDNSYSISISLISVIQTLSNSYFYVCFGRFD